jgi:predicted RNase H-like HicB family nuclease
MKNYKTVTIQEYELPVTIQEEEEGFIATCPVWPDCYAQGDTIEEAITEISYVASSLIELYKEEDMQIPLKLKSTIQNQPKGFTVSFPVIVSSS